MNEIYKINDNRLLDNFKTKTFSGFKKNDVLNIIFKSIENKKLENACHWTTECIISGYTLQLWDKIINFSSKIIHINNPCLPHYIYRKNYVFCNQLTHLDLHKNKNEILLLRNSQMIRNLFFDVITTLTLSSKTKRYDKYPKINEKEDFNFYDIQKRLCAQMNILPDNIVQFNDPNELKIIINEIFTLLKNKQFGYERCCYWILWLCKWETLHKKKKIPFRIEPREIKNVPKNSKDNSIWVVWHVVLKEVELRKNEMIEKQVKCLYELFKFNFTNGKKVSRLPLIFNAIGYLTHEINFNIPIRSDIKLFIKVQSNVNRMFKEKKINEIKDQITEKKKPPKKSEIEKEMLNEKILIFNSIDNI